MEGWISQIVLMACNFAPKNTAACWGTIIQIAQNTALFSLLGTTYGGNGTTNFALPDLRSRVPIGYQQGAGLPYYDLGETGGDESKVLLSTEMPAHSHTPAFTVANASATSANPGGNYLAAATNQGAPYSNGAPTVTLNAPTVQLNGGSQPFSLIQPALALNYCIVQYGMFPSRW